jgi:hypothetical protein
VRNAQQVDRQVAIRWRRWQSAFQRVLVRRFVGGQELAAVALPVRQQAFLGHVLYARAA